MKTNSTDEHPTYEKDNFKLQLFFELSLQGYITIYPEEGFIWNNITHREMGYVNTTGYVVIAWKYEKKSIQVLAHRLIWWTYYGPIEDHLTINHIDGNKQNNKINNLEKVTYRENNLHAFRMGLINPKQISESLKRRNETQRVKGAILTDDEVKEIRYLYKNYSNIYSQRKLSKKYSIHRSCIDRIVNKKSYKWVKDDDLNM